VSVRDPIRPPLLPPAEVAPVARPARAAAALHNGDRMTAAEFLRAYKQTPEDFRAELVEGVVYLMTSPVSRRHAGPHAELACILTYYKAHTPGVEVLDNTTVVLDEGCVPQPDLCLRLLPEFGGAMGENKDGDLTGPPELIVEVAVSSRALDLHGKREDYRAAGVREYLVLSAEDGRFYAFDFAGKAEPRPDRDGVYRSRAFPGLWLHPGAVLAGRTARAPAAARAGVESPAHGAFVKRLKARRTRRPAGRRRGHS
jgi:Uma2 family endonuclease